MIIKILLIIKAYQIQKIDYLIYYFNIIFNI
jgi:hypothetical protein